MDKLGIFTVSHCQMKRQHNGNERAIFGNDKIDDVAKPSIFSPFCFFVSASINSANVYKNVVE